jgi:hypothetical protein
LIQFLPGRGKSADDEGLPPWGRISRNRGQELHRGCLHGIRGGAGRRGAAKRRTAVPRPMPQKGSGRGLPVMDHFSRGQYTRQKCERYWTLAQCVRSTFNHVRTILHRSRSSHPVSHEVFVRADKAISAFRRRAVRYRQSSAPADPSRPKGQVTDLPYPEGRYIGGRTGTFGQRASSLPDFSASDRSIPTSC